ncbi:hypothetical protein [Pseudomonas aeruginosa]
MTVTFINKPIKAKAKKVTYSKWKPEFSKPTIRYVDQEPQEVSYRTVKYINHEPECHVFKGYDAEGRPVFAKVDEPVQLELFKE